MTRSRPALLGTLIVVAVVLLAAVGLFVIQYWQDSAVCSVLPGQPACSGLSSVQLASNALYASVAGLLAAVVLAMMVGVNVRRGQVPNRALAHEMDKDELNLEAYRARRAQLDEWTTMAQARAAQQAAQAEAAAMAAAEADAAFEAEAARWVQEESGDEEAQESEAQRRSRVLAEHLAQLARTKPEAVASVLSGWINQPSR